MAPRCASARVSPLPPLTTATRCSSPRRSRTGHPADSLRIRWESARFVTPNAIWQLLSGKPLLEEHWVVDGVSECLLPIIRNVPAASPFRVTVRSRAAVDRLGQGVEPHQTACLEFSRGSGIWMAFQFASKTAESRWSPALRGALKLIADSGLGGERSSGWGRFEQPEFADGDLGVLLFGNRYRAPEEVTGHWLLSLFSPAADDRIDWQQGDYRVVGRTGRVQSSAGSGAAKRANQMIAEGSVLVSAAAPKGTARDVAPAGFPHPVYRAGFALTLPIGKPRPPQLKPVVVDTTLLESLAKAEPESVEPPSLAESEPVPEKPVDGTAADRGGPLAEGDPVEPLTVPQTEPAHSHPEHVDPLPEPDRSHDKHVEAEPTAHAPAELPATQLEFSLEPAGESPDLPKKEEAE